MDPVGQFVATVAGFLSIVEAIARPAFYVLGSVACFKFIQELK
jgi:hypothetical protein